MILGLTAPVALPLESGRPGRVPLDVEDMQMRRWIVMCVWMSAWLSVAMCARAEPPHNIVLFVPDGLRAAIVDPTTAPAMARLREEGVNFLNSHSMFPTFTTANASAFATGHGIGDTGDFSNTIYTRLAYEGSITPFLESDSLLRGINLHYGGNYLDEPSIIAAAAAITDSDRISTALIGKVGPVAIFDPTAFTGNGTLVLDDSTGNGGIPILTEWQALVQQELIEKEKYKHSEAPPRGSNGVAPTFMANLAQQQYFLDMTLNVVLPEFKRRGQPFVLVYWTRDPDGTQHNQGDGGINGPTSMTAIRVADSALGAIEQKLRELGLYERTNIIVAADHGFSTIAKDSEGGKRELTAGFLAVDLALALRKNDAHVQLFDPDNDSKAVDPGAHTGRGNAVIGAAPELPQVVVAANGGSDLIYLPVLGPKGTLVDGEKVPSSEKQRIHELGQRIVQELLAKDYVSGLFVDDEQIGPVAGALALRDIGLSGRAKTPRPAIVVNFRTYLDNSCGKPEVLLCAREIADTTLAVGGGMHGSFSRADTWNFMAARGPDFREHYIDELPASNADIGMTVADLLHLKLTPVGSLTGRVLNESRRGHEQDPPPPVEPQTQQSAPAANGLKTVLEKQVVDGHTYFDSAGFPGRTIELGNR